MTKVLAFGSFDPLHEGHKQFLKQAKALGDYLTVVVAHDSAIWANKGYEPHQSEEERLKAVAEVPAVDEVLIGNKSVHKYELLDELEFDIIALGYDQQPTDEVVRTELNNRGKFSVKIVRLPAFHPEKYKSSYLRQVKGKA
jgi:FAD synthetase